jgi:FkbM family methyltransferase
MTRVGSANRSDVETGAGPARQFCYILSSEGDDGYFDMTLISIALLRQVHNHDRIILVLDDITSKNIGERAGAVRDLVDRVITVKADLPTAALRSRYLKTLLRTFVEGEFVFLDADTLVIDRCDEIFNRGAPLAAADDLNSTFPFPHTPLWIEPIYAHFGWQYPLSHYFNTGVVYWADSPDTRQLAQVWHDRWSSVAAVFGKYQDQPAFNSSVRDCGINVEVLPTIYNAMVEAHPRFVRGAKILHYFSSKPSSAPANTTLLAHLLHTYRLSKQIDWEAVAAASANGDAWIGLTQNLEIEWERRHHRQVAAIVAKRGWHALIRRMRSLLKQAVKKIPGSQRVVQRLIWSRNRSGGWLYHQSIIGWLYRPEFRRQMPAPYRLFASYCALQKRFSHQRIIGGEFVFNTALALNRLVGGKECARLDLGVYKVFLNLRDPRMLQVPNELLNKSGEAAAVRSFLSEGDTFLDVGANHGSFSIIAARQVGKSGLVVAVEPQPQMASLIEQSLAANAECPFQVHNFACGDRNGQADFYVPRSTSGSAGLFPEFSAAAPHRKLSVPLKRLDEAVDWKRFPGKVFVKLDVEGSELAFLRGGANLIRTRQPRLMIEINPKSSQAAQVAVEETVRYLQDLGYSRFIEVNQPMDQRPLRELDPASQRNVIVIP